MRSPVLKFGLSESINPKEVETSLSRCLENNFTLYDMITQNDKHSLKPLITLPNSTVEAYDFIIIPVEDVNIGLDNLLNQPYDIRCHLLINSGDIKIPLTQMINETVANMTLNYGDVCCSVDTDGEKSHVIHVTDNEIFCYVNANIKWDNTSYSSLLTDTPD